MSEPTNLQRARWAKAALTTFCKEVDGDDADELLKRHLHARLNDPEASTDFEDQISDLISDLLHLARFAGINVDKLLGNARRNLDHEIREQAAVLLLD